MTTVHIQKARSWIWGYSALLGVHLLAIVFAWSTVQFITKPLLMAWLLVYFLLATSGRRRFWVVVALFFSWLGDVMLMQEGQLYFMAGLGSFLLAHLSYIVFFWQQIRREQIQPKGRHWYWIGAGVYTIGFYMYLLPYLAPELILPVLMYALTIAAMWAMASRLQPLLLAGASLFVLSDSLLAINKFVGNFEGAGWLVMFTYGLAQGCIIYSISRTI